MAKKIINRNKKEMPRAERHFSVLLESMDSKLDLVVKGQGLLNQKVDRHYKEFQGFKEEASYKFEAVLDELHLIRNELKEKVSRDEFIILEKRVAILEKSMK